MRSPAFANGNQHFGSENPNQQFGDSKAAPYRARTKKRRPVFRTPL
jgi:hypothetical protein